MNIMIKDWNGMKNKIEAIRSERGTREHIVWISQAK
jgi:hypothetical protein